MILQVYMQTTREEDAVVDKMYEEISNAIRHDQGDENLIVIRDWNVSVGEELVNNYGLDEEMNEEPELLSSANNFSNITIEEDTPGRPQETTDQLNFSAITF